MSSDSVPSRGDWNRKKIPDDIATLQIGLRRTQPWRRPTKIDIRGLNFFYSKTKALDAVDLDDAGRCPSPGSSGPRAAANGPCCATMNRVSEY